MCTTCVCEREREGGRGGLTDCVISALGMECVYLGLSFHLCEMGILPVPPSLGLCQDGLLC